MFLYLSVSHSVYMGGSLTETPWTETPQTETPLDRDCPCTVTSGRYASYWNAFLFLVLFACQVLRTVHLNDGKVPVTQVEVAQLEVFGLCLYNRSSGNSNMAALRD